MTGDLFPGESIEGIPITTIVAELKREHAMRRTVYAGQIARGRLGAEVARERMRVLEVLIRALEARL